MLGGLAYQDSVGEIVIDKIKAKITPPIDSGGGKIRDIFVYDTRMDSDGGAWRKRTQHTSWYNEELGTKYRGTRREFPAVVVIVAIYDTLNRVVIYDGDDPNMPMWMMFERDNSQDPYLDGTTPGANHIGNYEPYHLCALNGEIYVATQRPSGHLNSLNAGLRQFRFIHDDCIARTSGGAAWKFNTQIAERQTVSMDYYRIYGPNRQWSGGLISSNALAVDAIALPGAPIDPYSKLPYPTIAVGQESGVTIIKDNGSTADLGYTSTNDNNRQIILTKNGKVHYGARSYGSNNGGQQGGNFYIFSYINPTQDDNDTPDTEYGYAVPGGTNKTNEANNNGLHRLSNSQPSKDNGAGYAGRNRIVGLTRICNNEFAFGTAEYGESGFWRVIEEETPNHDTKPAPMTVSIGSTHNTGWCKGNVRLAACSSTDSTDATATNLITNGTFDSNTNGWTASNATLSVSSGKMRILTSGQGYAYTTVTTVPYQPYVLTFDIPTDGNASAWIQVGSSGHGNSGLDLLNANPVGESNYAYRAAGFNFVATSTTTYITFKVSTSGSNKDIYIDNVVLQVGEKDHSPWQNNLAIKGTVPKSPVATGAELMAYGPFSSSNLLYVPDNTSSYSNYNDFSDIGTKNFTVTGWFYPTDATPSGDNDFFALTDAGPTTAIFMQVRTQGNLRFYTRDANGDTLCDSHAILKDNHWYHFVAIRTQHGCHLYINGEYNTDNVSNFVPRDVGSADSLFIGGRYQTNQNFCTTTKVALIRLFMGTPSEHEIKRMYNDEKQLFVENAKCTIYGNSDSVKGIDYDEGTGLLHVGTSAGRSDFSGLTRINNTTTPVTTAIAAANGLIVEE
tara:strand:- start:1512 stop:4043 length:2532 start_codon:yes stop_codon:yes gene_type:complete